MHEDLGWVWDGYQFITLINFELHILSSYPSFSENCLADWGEIRHSTWGGWGLVFTCLKSELLPIDLPFNICAKPLGFREPCI